MNWFDLVWFGSDWIGLDWFAMVWIGIGLIKLSRPVFENFVCSRPGWDMAGLAGRGMAIAMAMARPGWHMAGLAGHGGPGQAMASLAGPVGPWPDLETSEEKLQVFLFLLQLQTKST